MNYLTLPPEVTSTLMYSGPGSSPMTAAASAWSTLSADLKSSAAICESVINQLTGEGWLGTASASMAAAVTPYVTWMKVTAEQAEQAAAQARAAAAAYETAHGLTVPPVAVTGNRVRLQQLVATNIIGQNTAAIANTEIEHNEMWAQDTIAMHGYHAQSAAATTLQPFSNPPNPTDPSGEAAQGAAVGNAATSAPSHTASSALQSLLTAKSAGAGTITNPADDILKDPGYQLGNQTLSQLTSQANLQSNNMCAVWRGLSGVTGTQKLLTEMTKDAAKAASGASQGAASAAAGAAQGAASAAQGAGSAASGLGAVAGGMGRAGALGALSVPPSWVAPTLPPTTLGPVSGGTWQPVGPGILGSTPMAPPPGMPGVPGAAAAHGAGFRGFSAPRYGVQPTVMPKITVGG
ncbi:PPE family protein [Mycobacterium sp. M1]|uniref:PPE family protein n=1 Tax=Mycolicibacter acidiphilus TaxID=2835306 RepID=A0ABS5RDT0_9MYCO|nr:PPE family protein [Mycolicibacter acidiphilus]MBS9532436.1 PPE family protein [Mycolicibacter acidiphilus]